MSPEGKNTYVWHRTRSQRAVVGDQACKWDLSPLTNATERWLIVLAFWCIFMLDLLSDAQVLYLNISHSYLVLTTSFFFHSTQ